MPYELAGLQNNTLEALLGAIDLLGDDDDEMGDAYYVGDDDDDVGDDLVDYMIGAARKRATRGGRTPARAPARRVNKAAVAKQLLRRQVGDALAQRIAASKEVIVDKGVQSDGILPLGFDSVATIAAGASAAVTTNPQTLFAPGSLIVPASIASLFTIDDIKIGNRSQIPNSVPLPAEGFSQLSTSAKVRFKTAQTTMAVTLNVTNISLGAQRFRAMMVGAAAS